MPQLQGWPPMLTMMRSSLPWPPTPGSFSALSVSTAKRPYLADLTSACWRFAEALLETWYGDGVKPGLLQASNDDRVLNSALSAWMPWVGEMRWLAVEPDSGSALGTSDSLQGLRCERVNVCSARTFPDPVDRGCSGNGA